MNKDKGEVISAGMYFTVSPSLPSRVVEALGLKDGDEYLFIVKADKVTIEKGTLNYFNH